MSSMAMPADSGNDSEVLVERIYRDDFGRVGKLNDWAAALNDTGVPDLTMAVKRPSN